MNNTTTIDCLRILQWNCQGAMDKYPSINLMLNDVDICLLSETMLKEKNRLAFKGFRVLRSDSENGKLGQALIFRDTLPFSIIENIPRFPEIFDIQGIKIKTRD